MMKFLLTLLYGVLSMPLLAWGSQDAVTTVVIPYMEVDASHRTYANALLATAMELSRDRYGPYDIVQQEQKSVIKRHLLELEKGTSISVAVSMPTPEWLEKALPVRIPLLKGISSYRLFLGNKKYQSEFDEVKNLADLKQFEVGQGAGWSTGKILEDNGFKVVYGPSATLIPMLEANRFQLLMRGVFEVGPELAVHKRNMPNLMIVNNFAVYTYLPMYFFVDKNKPQLAERLEYGLKKAHANGQMDTLFYKYFSEDLKLLQNKKMKVFFLKNTNIDKSFFEQDKPYLLDYIVQLENESRH